jgi:predicted DNA-binding protein (MmcQ/YjbR family)
MSKRASRSSDPIVQLRSACLALPEAHEVEAWGEPTFRVRNKMFAMFASAGTHHGAGRPAVWYKAAPGEQALRIRRDPERYFSPPYVGVKGWVGMWLDGEVDWADLVDDVRDSYRLVAPRKLAALLAEP